MYVVVKIVDFIVVGLEFFKVVLIRFNLLLVVVMKGVGVVEFMVWSWLVMIVLWYLIVMV